MKDFKAGDEVYCTEYGAKCTIKLVVRDKCSVDFGKVVMGNNVKIVSLASLIPFAEYLARAKKKEVCST